VTIEKCIFWATTSLVGFFLMRDADSLRLVLTGFGLTAFSLFMLMQISHTPEREQRRERIRKMKESRVP
jgi:hypothetical protein